VEDGSVTTDEDTLQKAMQRKAAINLDCSGMSLKSSSFISLSTLVLSSKLNAVGSCNGPKKITNIRVACYFLFRAILTLCIIMHR
jgi:hypothetical protein